MKSCNECSVIFSNDKHSKFLEFKDDDDDEII